MASSYLSSQTSVLEATKPVPPSQAQAAQIPLQSFVLPTFPPEAFKTELDSLILTSDIKLDEYSDLLTKAWEIPELPTSIKSLTLELFALGYPAGFLRTLGERLSGLKSLTVFEQLFGGTVEGSSGDAVSFIKQQTQLKEVHILDTFAPKGFWKEIATVLAKDVKFLEIGVTYRHEDPVFKETLPQGEELAMFVKEGLVGLRFAMGAPIRMGDEEEGTEIGVMPVEGKDAGGRAVVKALMERGEGLVMCDVTLFELSSGEVENVLDSCGKLKVTAFSVTVGKGWGELFEVMEGKERGVEMLEIMAVPSEEWVEEVKKGGETGLERATVEKIGGKWKELKSIKISVLRTKSEEWIKDESERWAKK